MVTFDQFIASLERDFGEQGKGKPFEVFCKWFLENDPEWAKTIDKVWRWDEYPNKWQRQDLGTDLVFRDNEGLIWAVQAKCYAEHRTTTKGDMNSFLADTGRPEVHRRLWMQSTNKIEAKAEKTYKGQDKPVTVFTLNDFRDAQIEYPASFADMYQAKVKAKPKPDPHQIQAIEDVVAGLKAVDRGQMIMACGTGKTFTTLWIKEALEAHATLVLLPSLSLLSQTMREWAWAGNADFDILNVCSDASVGKKTEDMDPSDAPFPVTSDVDAIAAFLKRPQPKVVFCTYQSSDLVAQAQQDDAVPTLDLAVADEAHRCAGKADAGFATILDGSKIRASKRLFTTATPRYFGKAIKDAAKARDLAVVSMDDETIFGPVLHKLTFGQAIRYEPEPLLNDYHVVIVGVDEPMVRDWIENCEIVSTDSDTHTDARTLAAKIGLIKAIKDYDLERIISFHSRVKGARDFSEELGSVLDLIEPENRPDGAFLSDYVSGAMKAGDRKEKIDRLKQLDDYDRGILSNARCLAEGVDVPSLDGVAFIDPRGSQVEIIQAVGRAIRKVRGATVQKKGTIVLPVFIEEGDDPEASIEASNFKPVWDVLKALRAHDEVLADTLDQYRTNMAKNPSQAREEISDKIIFDMPVSVDTKFSSALRTVLVETSTASWEFGFGLLERFKEAEGHCKVPGAFKADGFSLGYWVGTQRKDHENMALERRQRLDDLGFVWDILADAWEEGFNKLLQFKKLQGHCKVPARHKTDGFNLGGWVLTQRQTEDAMSLERRQRLDEIGFVWDPFASAWDRGFSKLVLFKEVAGHCQVPVTQKVDGFKLGSWVSNQRSNKDTMSSDRRQKLDKIGFIWNSIDDAWDDAFNKLAHFKEVEGHCKVPVAHKIDGFKLGVWVSNQRKDRSSLSPDRRQRLDDIGFVWDAVAERWEEGFRELERFKETNGHLRVPKRFSIRGFKLGGWISEQRKRKASLPAERIERLDEIGFVWDAKAESWDEYFRKLLQFKEAEGHFNVPNAFTLDGFNLGSWVGTQRKERGKMVLERRQRLDEIGFVWDVHAAAWEKGFGKLVEFKEAVGHCKVPVAETVDGFRLGKWVSRQRTNNRLSQGQRQRLDDIGFVWNV